jgi:hypothetical protein
MNDDIDEQDDRLETWLASALVDEPLADRGFTTRVVNRIARWTKRRRAIVAAGWLAGAAVLIVSTPIAPGAWSAFTPAVLAEAMTLSALCGLVSLATTK